jgi:drug/metabolite transporter (DMT)-like permease
VTIRKQATLAGVVIFGALGDVALSRGMKSVGALSLSNWTDVIPALVTPWVAAGIVLLLAFFASYLAALSFADLTYVLPATAVGYILMAVLAKFFLHENISAWRWAGIALIALGVGFVTRGPAKTETARGVECEERPVAGGVR